MSIALFSNVSKNQHKKSINKKQYNTETRKNFRKNIEKNKKIV